MGLRMRRLLWAAGAAAAIAVVTASSASAATLVETSVGGDVTCSVCGVGTQIIGSVEGTNALSYAADFLDFNVGSPPPAVNGTVDVDVLFDDPWLGETWQLVGPGSTIIASGAPSNTPTPVVLIAGDAYSLQFASLGGPTNSYGENSFNIEVPGGDAGAAPIPGTLALFGGGLGLLGLTGLRKRKSKEPLSRSLIQA